MYHKSWAVVFHYARFEPWQFFLRYQCPFLGFMDIVAFIQQWMVQKGGEKWGRDIGKGPWERESNPGRQQGSEHEASDVLSFSMPHPINALFILLQVASGE